MSEEAIKEGQAFMANPDNLFKDGDMTAVFSTDIAEWTCAFMSNP